MSNQGEDGWYPECEVCDCGNLGGSTTICNTCLKDMTVKEFREFKQRITEGERT